MTQGDLPPLPPQHPGGFIWEPHAGRMRIVTDAEWGALADDLLPAVREAAAALANPLIRGANIHPMIVERATRLTELLAGGMPEVAARSPRVYMASLWLAEKYDTDRKLRGANDPMGEPLSDEMRAALVDLMAVLPSFVRQFPKVLQIEADNAAFFAAEALPGEAERLIDSAQGEDVIDAADASVLRDGLHGGGGDGPFHLRGPKASIFSLRNLVIGAVGAVALSVGHGFMGEIGAALSRGFGLPQKVEVWATARREDLEHLFSTAPTDVRNSVLLHLEALGKAPPVTPSPPPKPEGRTWVVDPEPGRGDFTMIQPAIDAASDGDKVVVQEGQYHESLHVSKSIEIIGQGEVQRIVVSAKRGDALRVNAQSARFRGLCFKREAGGNGCGATFTSGVSELENCIVESHSLTCIVAERKNTKLNLRRCVVRNGSRGGLSVSDGANILAVMCHFLGHTLAGVEVRGTSTRAEFRGCAIQSCRKGGLIISDNAQGKLEACKVSKNSGSGIEVISNATISIRDGTILDNAESGLRFSSSGRGHVEDCIISGNGRAGIEVNKRADPNVYGCNIERNKYWGVWIADSTATGTFTNNKLSENLSGAWLIAEGSTIIAENNLT